MNTKQIELLLLKKLDLIKTYVTGDNQHMTIIAIGRIFKGMSSVKRQQTVYAPLIKMIREKQIHAVSINAYTNEEWEKRK